MNKLPIDQIKHKLATLGLIVDNKVVTFKVFKEYAHAHEYGTRRPKLFVVYVGLPKDNLFGFYPMRGTKADALKESYQMYVDLINEDYEGWENDNVSWGNCGYPMGYRNLRCNLNLVD